MVQRELPFILLTALLLLSIRNAADLQTAPFQQPGLIDSIPTAYYPSYLSMSDDQSMVRFSVSNFTGSGNTMYIYNTSSLMPVKEINNAYPYYYDSWDMENLYFTNFTNNRYLTFHINDTASSEELVMNSTGIPQLFTPDHKFTISYNTTHIIEYAANLTLNLVDTLNLTAEYPSYTGAQLWPITFGESWFNNTRSLVQIRLYNNSQYTVQLAILDLNPMRLTQLPLITTSPSYYYPTRQYSRVLNKS